MKKKSDKKELRKEEKIVEKEIKDKSKRKITIIIIIIIIAALLILFLSYYLGVRSGGSGEGLPSRKPGASKMQCDDKIDNDGNGLCDYYGCKIGREELGADPGCESPMDDDESSVGEDADQDTGDVSGCNDTDGGKNYYEQGQVYSIIGPNAPESGEDSCLDKNLQYTLTNGTHLRETYCNSQGMYESDVVLCLYGCVYGACIKGYHNISCSDSDNGINPDKEGYVYNPFDYESPKAYDECTTNAFGRGEEDVKETYCNADGMFDTQFVECPEECANRTCTGMKLISYYPLEGGVAEDVIGNNEGIVIGVTEVLGVVGSALEFDGIDDSVLIQHDDSLNPYDSDFSMVFWFKCNYCLDTDISRKGSTATHNGGGWYKMEIGGYGTPNLLSLQWNTNSGGTMDLCTLESKTPVCDSQWHFAVGQRVGNFAELWIDGIRKMDYTTSRNDASCTGLINNTANLSIGSEDTQNDDFFNGTIDEVRFYQRALSESEILSIYNQERLN